MDVCECVNVSGCECVACQRMECVSVDACECRPHGVVMLTLVTLVTLVTRVEVEAVDEQPLALGAQHQLVVRQPVAGEDLVHHALRSLCALCALHTSHTIHHGDLALPEHGGRAVRRERCERWSVPR